jgi:integrase/recombinase XerD
VARPRVVPARPATPELTRAQALELLHAADRAPGPQRARTAALVAVLLFTGVRVSEVLGADVEDLGTEDGRRVLWVTRGDGQRRSLPLPGPAAAWLDAYLTGRPDLTDPPGRPRPPGSGRRVLFATGTGGRLFAADVWRVVRRLAAQAGLPDDLAGHLGPEAMRHSFATLYLAAGGSPSDLAKVMGHADLRTTRRYDPGQQAPGRSPGDVVAAYLAAAWRSAWMGVRHR